MAKSLVDYIFRWLEITFSEEAVVGQTTTQVAADVRPVPSASKPEASSKDNTLHDQFSHFMDDAPVCDQCGAITVRNGTCYRCFNCGNSMGCS